MGKLQRTIIRLLPARWADDVEAESRQWHVTCPACRQCSSIWDLGGIRWKARGNPRRFLRCMHCSKMNWMKLTKQESP